MFNVSGSFVVPAGVSYVRAIAVGGGTNGLYSINEPQPGGGDGYFNCSIIVVISGHSIGVYVGAGGTGAANSTSSLTISGHTAGGASSFGTYLVSGGSSSCEVTNADNQYGCADGTGSGANFWRLSCWNGRRDWWLWWEQQYEHLRHHFSTERRQWNGNTTYSVCLHLAKLHQFTASAGGLGGQPLHWGAYYSSSGGGGGVLLGGNGHAAQAGKQSTAC